MKIAILGSFPTYPYKERVNFRFVRKTLVSSFNINLAKALARLPSCEVHFYTFAPLWRSQTIKDQRLFIHFVAYIPRIDLVTFLCYPRWQIHNLLRQINPDIVHGIGTEHVYPYIALTSSYPSLITVHGIMHQVVRKLKPGRFSRKNFFAYFEKKSLFLAKHIIAINDYTIEQLKTMTKGQFYPVNNAIDPSFFNQPTSESYDIAFIGMIQERKNPLGFLKAVRLLKDKMPNLSVKVIGGPLGKEKGYYDQLLSYITENQLENNVQLCGQKTQPEVSSLLAQAKMLVLFSIEETSPMVISEAMALAKPVVATDVGGVKYMISDRETGYLVPSAKPEILAEAIETLLKDANLRKTIGQGAGKKALKLYRPEVVATKTMQVYEEVLKAEKKS